MKTRRIRPTFKIAARRFTAGLICMFTMISMMNIALPVSAADSTSMHIIFNNLHADGTTTGSEDVYIGSGTKDITVIANDGEEFEGLSARGVPTAPMSKKTVTLTKRVQADINGPAN